MHCVYGCAAFWSQQVQEYEAATASFLGPQSTSKHTTHGSYARFRRCNWTILLLPKPCYSQILVRVVGCCECGGKSWIGELAAALLVLALGCVGLQLWVGFYHLAWQSLVPWDTLLTAFSPSRPVKLAADGMLIGDAVSPAACLSFGPFGCLQSAVLQL
jgi:hypothetical protein